jgi:Protein of unknown function with HXXEE motif
MVRRLWPLLFPLTYLVHIAEEYYGGFPQWASHYLSFRLTTEAFLELNIIAWTIMLCASVLAVRFDSLVWLTVPFAAATFINGCAHAIASAITVSYSPGLISGLALWVPLGIVTLRHNCRQISHGVFWAGVGFGVLLHLAITLTARAS